MKFWKITGSLVFSSMNLFAPSDSLAKSQLKCIPGKFFEVQGVRNQVCYYTNQDRKIMVGSVGAKNVSDLNIPFFRCRLENGASQCSTWNVQSAEKLGVNYNESLKQVFSNEDKVPTAPLTPKPESPVEQSNTGSTTGASGCDIPAGPIAYNIGSTSGKGVQCKNARSIVVEYMGKFDELAMMNKKNPSAKKFGMGYINPLVETNEISKFGPDKKICFSNTDGSKYCEGKFNDYGSAKAVKYLTTQIKHWKEEGKKLEQSCVPVDIDNCDGIGTENYQKVMDLVAKLNKEDPKIKVKVFVKNAHEKECQKFLNHPSAIGAFIEEISAKDVNNLVSLRTDPSKILLFAQGSQREAHHESLASISKRGIPNSSVSIGDGDYNQVNKCVAHGPSQVAARSGSKTSLGSNLAGVR